MPPMASVAICFGSQSAVMTYPVRVRECRGDD
jgi:hypothetical protein